MKSRRSLTTVTEIPNSSTTFSFSLVWINTECYYYYKYKYFVLPERGSRTNHKRTRWRRLGAACARENICSCRQCPALWTERPLGDDGCWGSRSTVTLSMFFWKWFSDDFFSKAKARLNQLAHQKTNFWCGIGIVFSFSLLTNDFGPTAWPFSSL